MPLFDDARSSGHVLQFDDATTYLFPQCINATLHLPCLRTPCTLSCLDADPGTGVEHAAGSAPLSPSPPPPLPAHPLHTQLPGRRPWHRRWACSWLCPLLSSPPPPLPGHWQRIFHERGVRLRGTAIESSILRQGLLGMPWLHPRHHPLLLPSTLMPPQQQRPRPLNGNSLALAIAALVLPPNEGQRGFSTSPSHPDVEAVVSTRRRGRGSLRLSFVNSNSSPLVVIPPPPLHPTPTRSAGSSKGLRIGLVVGSQSWDWERARRER